MAEEKTVAQGADIPEDIAKMSFEEALEELENIVTLLERGEAPLEQSIEIYARGIQLKAHCANKLKAAEMRIEKIVTGPGGEAEGTEPFDIG